MMPRTCPICTKEKTVGDFGICRARPDGRNLYCKECIRIKVTKNRIALKEWKKNKKEREKLIAEVDELALDRKPNVISKRSPRAQVRHELAEQGPMTREQLFAALPKLKKDIIGQALAALFDSGEAKPARDGNRAWSLTPAGASKEAEISVGESQEAVA